MSFLSRLRAFFSSSPQEDLTEPAKVERRVKISGKWVPRDIDQPRFTNQFLVNIRREEVQFLLTQTNFVNDDADPSAFFVVTPQRLVEFRDVLTRAVAEYEKHYGSISPSGSSSNGTPPPVLH